MKEYLQNRLFELNAELAKAQNYKRDNPLELGIRADVNEHLILMYVFATSEIEKALKHA